LDVLYYAQRRAVEHHHAPANSVSRYEDEPTTYSHNSQSSQQRSLHSFWNLPHRPSPSSSAASSPASSAVSLSEPAPQPQCIPTACEDCGAGLTGCDDDAMMDVDEYGLGIEGQVCEACRKAVCFSCSVSNLGKHRRCLACAGPQRGFDGCLRTRG